MGCLLFSQILVQLLTKIAQIEIDDESLVDFDYDNFKKLTITSLFHKLPNCLLDLHLDFTTNKQMRHTGSVLSLGGIFRADEDGFYTIISFTRRKW